MNPSRRTLVSFLPLLVLPLVAGVARAQSVVEVAGQPFERAILLDGVRLQLNGTGVRAVAWFKGYAIGLYLTGRAFDAAQAEAMPGPKRLQLRMLVDVPAGEFTKAFYKGITRNSSPAQLTGLGDRMERFARQIDAVGTVHKGDVVDLDYEPARGLRFSINGKLRAEPIPGEDLYAALLRSFVGEKPYDVKMRAGLLGGRA